MPKLCHNNGEKQMVADGGKSRGVASPPMTRTMNREKLMEI